jgi:hypothetical protein
MKRSWGQLGLVGGALVGLLGCGDGDAVEANLGQVTAVEVTTVTTVQASGGVFLSPRPRQQRPEYVEVGVIDAAPVTEPSAELDRAKVDTALLFRAAAGLQRPLGLEGRFDSSMTELLPQHFYPALSAAEAGAQWDITLHPAAEVVTDDWTEWGGWRAYPGLTVGATAQGAGAATLDYETLGLRSPLVLTMVGDDVIITNRSEQTVRGALLIYDHERGVGIRAVDELGPGMESITTTGPKEGNVESLLEAGRIELEAFFGERLGADLGRAVARAKSVPLLETLGMRLVYLLDEEQAPPPIALPEGLAARQRFVICQAEVLIPTDEAHTLELLAASDIEPGDVTSQLGRFTRARLEVAQLLGGAPVQSQAAALLETLTE